MDKTLNLLVCPTLHDVIVLGAMWVTRVAVLGNLSEEHGNSVAP